MMAPDDWHRWYNGVIGRSKETGRRLQIKGVYNVAGDECEFSVYEYFDDNSKKERRVMFSDIDFSIPRLGAFDVEGLVYSCFLEWKAERQYQKGFNLHALTVDAAHDTPRLLNMQGPHRVANLPLLAKSVYAGEVTPYEVAYLKINDGDRLSCTLSRRMVMGIHRDFPKPVLYYNKIPIGFCLKDGVDLRANFAYPEVNTFARVL